jgi:hypothetical protein
MAGEIWHLSIDDLFQPLQEAPRLGGEGPFVINLSASTAPISIPANAFAGCSDAHVYQIQVTEDGRTRYRLRVGPFATEDEADAVLAVVRDTYPGALTATAGASDSRVIASMQAKIEARQASARKPAKDKADAEISIDIAWPTPELAVPPTRSVSAAPTAAPVAIPPAAAAPLELAPEWASPKLDIPPPSSRESNLAAKAAPVLTEVVVPAVKAPAPSVPAPRMLAPTPAVAPVLTDAVAPKAKSPAVTAPAAATSTAPAPTFVAPVAPPPKAAAPVAPVPVAPVPVVPVVPVAVTPVPARIAQAAPEPAKQTATPAKPAPPKVAAPPPKVAAPPPRIAAPPPRIAAPPPRIAAPPPRIAAPPPRIAAKMAAPLAAEKSAPVLTQSVLSHSKAATKLRQSAMKPSANRLTSLQHVVVATAPARAAREVKELDEPLESLESTQTMRALTPTELDDIEASRWFVIELSVADEAFDPDAVPNLDIFSEYRLYSVAGLDQGRVVHALRLGFFREEVGAVAVSSYLAAYWDKPAIKRVSLAERERFADQRVEARKDVGATGRHAVIEITDELVARRKRSSSLRR